MEGSVRHAPCTHRCGPQHGTVRPLPARARSGRHWGALRLACRARSKKARPGRRQSCYAQNAAVGTTLRRHARALAQPSGQRRASAGAGRRAPGGQRGGGSNVPAVRQPYRRQPGGDSRRAGAARRRGSGRRDSHPRLCAQARRHTPRVSSHEASPHSSAPLGEGARAPSAGAPGPCERSEQRSEQRLRHAAPAGTSSWRAPGFESRERGPCARCDCRCGLRSKEEEDAGLAALESRLRGAAAAQGGEETHKALDRAKAKARGPAAAGAACRPCPARRRAPRAAASARWQAGSWPHTAPVVEPDGLARQACEARQHARSLEPGG